MHRHREADAAHGDMRGHAEHQRHEHEQCERGDEHAQSRQHEYVETVVQAELRIDRAEALVVEHEQNLGPVRIDLGTENDARDQRDDHRHAASSARAHALADLDGVTVDADCGAIGEIGTCTNGQSGGNVTDEHHEGRIEHP